MDGFDGTRGICVGRGRSKKRAVFRCYCNGIRLTDQRQRQDTSSRDPKEGEGRHGLVYARPINISAWLAEKFNECN